MSDYFGLNAPLPSIGMTHETIVRRSSGYLHTATRRIRINQGESGVIDKNKKPLEMLYFKGFLLVSPAGFEPTTF
jgi:hypothetical protein